MPAPRGDLVLGGVPAPKGGPPGPHPRGKLRGIRSRPTPKGEIEGDQIQAHTQGGNWGIRSRPTSKGKFRGISTSSPPRRLLLRAVRILLECILVKNIFEEAVKSMYILEDYPWITICFVVRFWLTICLLRLGTQTSVLFTSLGDSDLGYLYQLYQLM